MSQYVNEQSVLRTHMQRIMEGVIDEIKENAAGFLAPAQHAAELSRQLFASGMLTWSRRGELERYFLEQLRVIRQLDALYYGDRQGQYLMVKREPDHAQLRYLVKTIQIDKGIRRVEKHWRNAAMEVVGLTENVDDNYDPRKRPWYKSTLARKEVIWTDPYLFFTSKHPGITTAIPIFDDQDRVQGVVGVDIEIGQLSEFLGQQNVGQAGSALIINRQGDYIAHSDAERIRRHLTSGDSRLARVDELQDPIEQAALAVFKNPGELLNFAWLEIEDTLRISFDVDGEQYHSIFKPFPKERPWPWVVGVYAAESDFIGSIRRGERTKIILAILVSAAITLIAFLLAKRFIRPVVALRDEVDLDVLTGIRNRRSLFDIAPVLVSQAQQNGLPLSLIILDIDRFKQINDMHGHIVGDQVLEALVDRLTAAIGTEDLLARYAGDEFVLLLPRTELVIASRVAERLRATFSGVPIKTALGEIPVTISLGVADLAPEREDFETIFNEADRALRSAKSQGRNRVAVADESPAIEGSKHAVGLKG